MNENEMRFSQSSESSQPENTSGGTQGKKFDFVKRISKKVLKPILFVLILVAVIVLGFYAKNLISKGDNLDANASPYSAVFLTNGQVYFGRVVGKDNSEFVLSEVFYLQISGDAAAQAQLTEPKFSLVKLGNELHGPTDKLYINTSQVLFYENLREDSKVVQSIKDFK